MKKNKNTKKKLKKISQKRKNTPKRKVKSLKKTAQKKQLIPKK